MDSVPPIDGFLLEIVDNEWRKDTLPFEKIFVPDDKLPDAEADNGDVQLTLNELEQKWSDLALSTLAPDIATIADQINVNAV